MILPWGLTTRTVERIAAGVVIVGLLVWIYHQGGVKCRADVAITQAHQQVQQAKVDARDTVELAHQRSDYDARLATPPAAPPVVRLCQPRHAVVQSSPAARPQDHGEARLGGEDSPDGAGGPAPGPDIGPALVTTGRDGDAQIEALQAYIAKVCLAPRP